MRTGTIPHTSMTTVSRHTWRDGEARGVYILPLCSAGKKEVKTSQENVDRLPNVYALLSRTVEAGEPDDTATVRCNISLGELADREVFSPAGALGDCAPAGA
ncbi:unnamed protein product [Ectocarpus fasciculatus]